MDQGKRRLAAEQPTPRATCPGCLADLRDQLQDGLRGWCPTCYLGRDDILAELLRVTDPRWKVPAEVLNAEDEVLRLAMEGTVLRARSEAALRAHSKAEAALRYLLARMGVCLTCRRAPADRSQTCPACHNAWREGKG